MVVTADPETGVQNIGMYRMQVFGPDTTGMHWQQHKGGAGHCRAWKRTRGGRMPVVVAIGGDPATMYTPTAPLPPGIDEYLFGGFLRREPVYTCKALTADLTIPAQAEIVLEGYVDTDEELAVEGPSATTRGSTRWRSCTRSSTSPPSPCARTRSTRRRWSAGRRWRTCTWAAPRSGCSCRWRGSPCRRSSTTTCPRRGCSTTWCSSPSARSIRGRRSR
jgi:hypothetical protein